MFLRHGLCCKKTDYVRATKLMCSMFTDRQFFGALATCLCFKCRVMHRKTELCFSPEIDWWCFQWASTAKIHIVLTYCAPTLSTTRVKYKFYRVFQIRYSGINVVWPTLKHAISPSKYILSHTPWAVPICEIIFRRFFLKNQWVKNEKSIKNVVTYFFEFIGFMVFKTTVLISQLTSF